MTTDGGTKISGSLRYSIARFLPGGGVDQPIERFVNSVYVDPGFHCSVAVTDDGTIVEVHESGSNGKGMYYRVLHVEDPNAGDDEIVWGSGKHGVPYDNGINPHSAINNKGDAIKMHQVNQW
jgi:hypothetical protein